MIPNSIFQLINPLFAKTKCFSQNFLKLNVSLKIPCTGLTKQSETNEEEKCWKKLCFKNRLQECILNLLLNESYYLNRMLSGTPFLNIV